MSEKQSYRRRDDRAGGKSIQKFIFLLQYFLYRYEYDFLHYQKTQYQMIITITIEIRYIYLWKPFYFFFKGPLWIIHFCRQYRSITIHHLRMCLPSCSMGIQISLRYRCEKIICAHWTLPNFRWTVSRDCIWPAILSNVIARCCGCGD